MVICIKGACRHIPVSYGGIDRYGVIEIGVPEIEWILK
jgi:hypothetical protein